MDKVLQQINLVHGVIGCLVCNNEGEVLANAFPPIFDTHVLQNAASLSIDSVAGVSEFSGGVDLIDLHCSDGRILIKNMPKGCLLLLCVGTLNMQMLNISLNVAVNKLNASLASDSLTPLSPACANADQLASSKSTNGSLQRDGKGFILTVDSLAATAKLPWDQMQEGVAISKKLSEQICGTLEIDAIKKMKLTNKTTKTSKSFNNIRVFERDNAQTFDDRITITLATVESLKAKPGDELFVEINVGGLFG
jgi:predicted regulator of Ras-like GTPase activity (Roadblock/LC7/MglB family)